MAKLEDFCSGNDPPDGPTCFSFANDQTVLPKIIIIIIINYYHYYYYDYIIHKNQRFATPEISTRVDFHTKNP